MAKFKRGWLGGKTKLIISSPYGNRWGRKHRGNDIAVPTGTPIYAPCDGTVTKKSQVSQGGKPAAGLYIILKGKKEFSDYSFYFMHLHEVKKTGAVKEGELIGTTGGAKSDGWRAGSSRGPHLHFEVRKGSTPIDSKFFVSDEWISRTTGRRIANNNAYMPLISKNEANYTEEEKNEVAQNTNTKISDDEIAYSDNFNALTETDWSESEDDPTEDIYDEREYQEGFVAGIWQIIKLAMDAEVAELRIRDVATSLQQGSLINFFQKVCQQPFAEFFGDTYGDQYYFITRKPPIDKEGMWKTMYVQGLFNQTNDTSEVNAKTTDNTIYDIYEKQLISSNISFNTQNIYSWYQFYPIYAMGSPSELQYMIPAVLFPEYASIWGSRSLIVRSQYRNFLHSDITDKVKNGEKTQQGDIEVQHSIKDLKYLIESNAYAPFVRQGTIQLNGNRKIKRGTFIRIHWDCLSCGEIFYVESVSQNYSVNNSNVTRTTTLNLSHGMLEDYMFNTSDDEIVKLNKQGEKIGSDKISYFNIIDFGEYEKYKDILDMDKWREIISKWKVNTEVFMFFLRKMQFSARINSSGANAVAKTKNVL